VTLKGYILSIALSFFSLSLNPFSSQWKIVENYLFSRLLGVGGTWNVTYSFLALVLYRGSNTSRPPSRKKK
jgi:hypothetical protein